MTSIEFLEARRLLSAGEIDPYYGNAGAVPIASTNVLIARDDKVITIARGRDDDTGDYSLTLDRFNADGSADPTFHVFIPASKSLLRSETGSRVVATFDSAGRLFTTVGGRIYCILPNGRLDKTFGAKGIVNTPFTSSIQSMTSNGNRILVGGEQEIDLTKGDYAVNVAAAICAITPDGKRDTNFGPKGVRYLTPFVVQDDTDFRREAVVGLAYDIHGDITARVDETSGIDDLFFRTEHHKVTFMRVRFDGVPDTSFGPLEGQTQFTYDLFDRYNAEDEDPTVTITGTVLPNIYRMDSQGRLVVLLNDANPNDPAHSQIMRRLSNGAVDPSFSGDGFLDSIQINGQYPDFDAFTFLAGNKLLVAAHLSSNSAEQYLIRLNDDGSLDDSFGTGGLRSLGTSRDIVSIGTFVSGAIISVENSTEGGSTSNVLRRLWPDDAPAATLSFRHITSATTRPQTLDVTYRDDGSLDLASLDNRDLRIESDNGFAGYAKFLGVISSSNNNGLVTARYRLAAPGGSWNSTDNGLYFVSLRASQVRDSQSNAAAPAFLGTFLVRVRNVATTSSLHAGLSFPTAPIDDLVTSMTELL